MFRAEEIKKMNINEISMSVGPPLWPKACLIFQLTIALENRCPELSVPDRVPRHDVQRVDAQACPLGLQISVCENRMRALVGDVEVTVDLFAQPAGLDIPGFLALLAPTERGIVLLGHVAQVTAQVHDLVVSIDIDHLGVEMGK